MNRDFSKVAVKVLALTLIMLIISVSGIIAYSSKLLLTSNTAYIDKKERLASITGQKAVFVGGSATNFGVHAEDFEKATGIASVNMGLNADVAYYSYIDSILPYLNEGDLIFLIPEYSYYSKGYRKMGETDVHMRFYFDRSLLNQMNIVDTISFIAVSASTGIQNWSSIANETIRDVVFKEGYGVYYRKGSNEYGDFSGHKDLPSKPFASLALEHELSDFIMCLEKDIQRLQSKGVRVFLLFPPYENAEYALHAEHIDKIYSEINRNLSAIILFKPQDSVYPTSEFFDTVYHLRWAAASEYTEMIIEKYRTKENL